MGESEIMSLLTELYSIQGLTKEQIAEVEKIGGKFEQIINKLRRDILKKDPEYQREIDKINKGEFESELETLSEAFKDHSKVMGEEIWKLKTRVEILEKFNEFIHGSRPQIREITTEEFLKKTCLNYNQIYKSGLQECDICERSTINKRQCKNCSVVYCENCYFEAIEQFGICKCYQCGEEV
jgi:hypothetical protein